MIRDEFKLLAVIILILISVVALPYNISLGFDNSSEKKSDSSEPVGVKQSEADPTEIDHNPDTTVHSKNRITHASRIPYVSREKSMDRSSHSNEDDFFSLNSIVYEGDHHSRDSIRINSDEEFDEIAEQESWLGDGSEEAPYRIEGYEIDGNNSGYGIYVGNVTSRFVINDCYIFNAEGNGRLFFRDSGIYLYNTSNAILKDNIISSNRYGIYIQESNNNTVSNNTLFANTGPGVFLLESDENSIYDNKIRDENEIDENQDADHEEDSVLVKFDEPFDSLNVDRQYLKGELNRIAGHIDASPDRVFTYLNAGVLELNDDMDIDTAIRILSNMPSVDYAEPNYRVELLEEPNDPGFPSLWGMKDIDATGAWDVNTGSREVVVAVLDTGIDYNHEDLSDNMWEDENGYHGYNFVNDSHVPIDDHNHGTHVAGTIGAVGNNSVGVVGVNWNVSLMSLKFIDESGRGSISDAIASLEYVLERKKEGVNVVATSNSWGGAGRSKLLSDAISEHRNEDILFIAAAGNGNRNVEERPFYPASFEHTNVISVGATDRGNNRTSFSNYGPNSVHVGAPG
ncbi:MAG: S8 family serine peptidase, partial [Thermoplasmatota archaeon]